MYHLLSEKLEPMEIQLNFQGFNHNRFFQRNEY